MSEEIAVTTLQRLQGRDADQRLDALFGALSDRTRRALVAKLRDGPRSISELAAPFAMSFPALSRHVRVLEHAGLVHREIIGRVHRCALAPAALRDVDHWLDHYRAFWGEILDSLDNHVHTQRARRSKK